MMKKDAEYKARIAERKIRQGERANTAAADAAQWRRFHERRAAENRGRRMLGHAQLSPTAPMAMTIAQAQALGVNLHALLAKGVTLKADDDERTDAAN